MRELSALNIEPPRRGALLIGYAALDEDEIREGVRRLALAMREKQNVPIAPMEYG